ncbi:MAG: undecaprenyldiphospho-muramoylpentapeptide beta-N-acetylglucosaminyltransferase [Spirochaetales bacterium]|nr:undecaprenyldiphospho-muramoylpentapeptide beta-N-acetylglucosaminyltransferase [Spirochaetales bacterium]
MKKIIITGGGSGGHAMPAVATAQLLRNYEKKSGEQIKILYVGSKKGIEKKIATRNHCAFISISTGKLRRYFSWENFLDCFRIIKGIFDSISIIKHFKPDMIFSTGGFVSVPVVIAGYFTHTPSVIHEQTADAGLANKIAGKFAKKIALTFEESSVYFPASKTVITGIPLRESIFNADKEKAYTLLPVEQSLPTVYVSGGGLGCHLLNETMLKILPELLEKMNIIIQTGNADDGKDYLNLLRFRENLDDELKKHLIVFNFVEDVGNVFAISDLVVARSGAGTVNELIALKLPAVFIPLAIATGNEQFKNASVMEKIGGAQIIEEKNLTPEILQKTINEILTTGKLAEMKKNLLQIKNFYGNKELLKLILQTLDIKDTEE